MNDVNQIYHVARCGSTLMTFLLSQVVEAYSEPAWSRARLNGANPFSTVEKYYGSVVKFPSLATVLPDQFNGKKVFLYRPLAQHLCKLKSLESEWLDLRLPKINYLLENYKHPILNEWQPTDQLDKSACIWACSVLRMIDSTDVLWIKANEFFKDKRTTIDIVCDHFNLPYVPDLNVANVNAKQIKINGQDTPIRVTLHNQSILNSYYIPWVYPSHGIIENDIALADKDIKERVEIIEEKFPALKPFLY